MNKLKTLCFIFLSSLVMGIGAYADSELEEIMDGMNDDYKLVGKALIKGANPADKQDYLAALQRIQEAMLKSKLMVPTLASTLGQEEKDKMVNDYRLEMIQAIIALLQVETDILKDDYIAAKASFGALKESKKRGHDAYQEEDE